MAAALMLGVVFPLAVAAWTGSLSIPHNDAWAYSKAAQTFAHTGHIRLLNWNVMALVGLFVPLGPLGASITAQQCYVALLAAVGLVASFDLLRAAAGPRRAALGTLALAAWPGFGLLATSMMTDMPAYAVAAMTLALGRRAVERGSWHLFVLTALAGLWGLTIREQTIAAPAAVLLTAVFRTATRLRALVVGTALVGVGGIFELWRRGLDGGSSPSFANTHTLDTTKFLTTAASAWLMVGLVLSPLVLLAARPRRWSPAAQAGTAAMVALLLVAVLGDHKVGLPQNYLERRGPYPSAFLGHKPFLFPQALWDGFLCVAVVSGALLVGLLMHRVRAVPRELQLFLAFTVVVTAVEIHSGQLLFDRYLIMLALPLAAVALVAVEPVRPRPNAGTVQAALAALCWLTLASVTGLSTLNGLVYDAATWHAARAVVSAGDAAAASVNAGFAWTAYYSATGAVRFDRKAERGTYVKTAWFSDDQPCYVVAASVQHDAGWKLVESHGYRDYDFFGPTRHVYVYRTAKTACH